MAEEYQEWFTTVFGETLAFVRRYAFSLVKRFPDLRLDVDGLVQETYVCMYNNKESLYAQEDVERWLAVTLWSLVARRVHKQNIQTEGLGCAG